MSEHVSITEELRARIEELTRERDAARESVVDTLLERERLRESSARYKRERDEAREERDGANLSAKAAMMAYDSIEKMVRFELVVGPEESLRVAVQRIRYERDEAREERDDYRARNVDMCTMLNLCARDRDEARAHLHIAGVRADNAERREKARAKERDAALAELEWWKAQHLESQHNGAREAIARKSAEAEVERLKVERDEAREKVQSRGRKAISPQELNTVVAALHDALLSTPRPNTDALRPRLGWPRRKTYAVVREAVRLGMIERVGVYRWTWFRMPFRRSDKP